MSATDTLSLPGLAAAIEQALNDVHQEIIADDALLESASLRAVQASGDFRNDRQAINQLLENAIALLKESNAQQAELLRLRFFQGLPIHRVAVELNTAESTVYVWRREAIATLVQIIESRERRQRAELRARLHERLPSFPETRLVGADRALEALLAAVRAPGSPWIISLEGIGGIGKTALANALLRRVVELGLYDEIGWVSAQPARLNPGGEILETDQAPATAPALLRRLAEQLMPDLGQGSGLNDAEIEQRLRSRLRQTPHLIVVDNLESLADVRSLVPKLQELAAPTKFVLTTRDGLSSEPNVFTLSVTELGQEHALTLVRQVANSSNLTDATQADDARLAPIYETVGGNPLALRLVVGQLHLYSLQDILDDLRAARGMAVENLYTYIYRRAWDRLDETGREALLAAALLPVDGDTLAFWSDVSALSPGDLRAAVRKLAMLNLVEVGGTIERRTYAIHSLTRTFLLEQVAKWM